VRSKRAPPKPRSTLISRSLPPQARALAGLLSRSEAVEDQEAAVAATGDLEAQSSKQLFDRFPEHHISELSSNTPGPRGHSFK